MTAEERDELATRIDVGLGTFGLPEEAKHILISSFCHVNPPELPELDHRVDMIRILDGGRQGGVGIKPGNIKRNWRKLVGAIPGMVLTGAGATTNSWLVMLGALVIWKDLYSTSRVDLTPHHATAMFTMWNNRDGERRISEAKARLLTNRALGEFDLNQVSELTFAKIIDDLAASGCLELSNGEIWLRDWIRRSWP